VDDVEQRLIDERLLEEIDRASLHRPHAGRYVGATTDEDDRDLAPSPDQTPLEFKPAGSRKVQVEHEASRTVGHRLAQKVSADANVATSSPTARRSRSSEQRIEYSSSITKTIGCLTGLSTPSRRISPLDL
jgi:hypothetical protein